MPFYFKKTVLLYINVLIVLLYVYIIYTMAGTRCREVTN